MQRRIIFLLQDAVDSSPQLLYRPISSDKTVSRNSVCQSFIIKQGGQEVGHFARFGKKTHRRET